MMKVFSGAFFISAALILAGCSGGDDFSGLYKAEGNYGKPTVVLNITSGSATAIPANNSTGELEGVPTDFKVDYKNGKMLLDSSEENIHLTFKRADDERGLTCLNCRETLGLSSDWRFVQPEPLDINSILKKQQEKRQAIIDEEVKRRAKASELVKFQGDWVGKRNYKDHSLLVTSITTNKGIKIYAFSYQSAAKLNEYNADFEIDGNDLVIIHDGTSSKYTLDENSTKLKCTNNCGHATIWLKANPEHVNDINYVRELAGNPLKNSWE